MSLNPTTREIAEARSEKIRDAAKWLVGSFAAVGAALIAGSQLSSIGQLPLCTGWSLSCLRLPLALLGAAAGLGGVVWAIWTAVLMLVPNNQPASTLQKEWMKGEKSAVFRFFNENRPYLQGYKDFADLDAQERAAYAKRDELSERYDRAEPREQDEIRSELEALPRVPARRS